jgi:ParB-like chromosome segregation protein Spo0J
MEFHDVANIFPMMGDEEYRALVADIKANGLHQPIWTYQDKIIDGRNRYKACAEADIEPKFQEWDGNGSLVAFVVSLNLNRRHLTSSQKAMVAIEIEKYLAEEKKVGRPAKDAEKDGNISVVSGESRAQAAAIVGTNSHYVTDAKRIAAKAPELKEAVLAGTLSIPNARDISCLPAEMRTQVLEKINGYAPGWEDHPNRLQRAIRDVEDKRRADENEAQWKAKLESGEYERQAKENQELQEKSRREYERQLKERAEQEAAWIAEMRTALNAPGSEHRRTQLYEAAREVDRQLHQMARASMIFLMRFEDLVGGMFNEEGLLGRWDIPSEWSGNQIHHYTRLANSFFRDSHALC